MKRIEVHYIYTYKDCIMKITEKGRRRGGEWK
jgi:hypothetical protein